MSKPFAYILAFLLFGTSLPGQNVHFLRCIEIQDNNSAVISWQTYNQGDFENYSIYHSNTSNGPYQLLGTITDASQNIFTQNGIDPVTDDQFYFIRINKATGEQQDSDTLKAIKLRTIPIQDGRIAWLRWNAPKSPPLPSANNKYEIYRKYSFGNWEKISSTDALSYYDTIRVCQDSINYRIELQDNSGCRSVSNVYGALLYDLNPPPLTRLDSVSITPEAYTILGWEASKDSGVHEYKIAKPINTGGQTIWKVVDSVAGIGNTFYVDSNSNPCQQIEQYKIIVEDSCFNNSGSGIEPGTGGKFMQSILLDEINYNPCTWSNTISWSPFINMPGGLASYEVFLSIDGGSFQLLASLPADSLSMKHTELQNNTRYEYFIRAKSSSEAFSSTSCVKGVITYYPALPEFVYLRNVTVEDQQIKLNFFVDTAVQSQGYIVERSENFTGPFQQIDTIPPASGPLLQFIDPEANPSEMQYYYRIHATDSCAKKELLSNYGTNILLEAIQLEQDVFRFEWNEYEDFNAGVHRYELYRFSPATGALPIDVFWPPQFSYEYDFSNYPDASSYIYYISAIEEEGNLFGFRDTARSNNVLLQLEPEIFMPNAFAPERSSNALKPILRFVEAGEYSFRIFNRWGEMIFQTSDPGKGWNGRVNGKYAPMGVYAYLITYQDDQNSIQKKGTITLIY